jgi:hypothetical protein
VPTATPTPTVSVKFTEKPDDVDAGTDAHFEVQTNAKSGTCNLTITYRDSSIVGLGAKAVDDDRCSWTFNVPATTKPGKAKAVVTVSGSNGSASANDSFTVQESDTVYGGNVELEIEDVDLPDDVTVGQEVKVSVDTNITRSKGRCELQIAWPGYAAFTGDSMATDDKGRCSWKTTAPAAIPAKGTATLTLTVRKSSVYTRTVTKQFEVKK